MRQRGFTLVEVMVALAVVAIALPALMMSLYQQMDDTGYLRDKSIAQMVAANKLAEKRIVVAATQQLAAGKDGGQVQFAQRDWYWWSEIKTTEVARYFRMEIAVGSDESQRESPLYTLVAFMTSDLEVDSSALSNPGGNGGGNGGSNGGGNGGGDGGSNGGGATDIGGQINSGSGVVPGAIDSLGQ